MFLNEVHEQLCSAELSLTKVGEGATLSTESLPKINALIQAGINDLNKRFTIRENELLLRTNPDLDVYQLIPDNAVSSGNPNAYIIDDPLAKYEGDLMQILQVTGSNGEALWLNVDTSSVVSTDNLFGKNHLRVTHSGINFLSYNTLKLTKPHDLGDVLIRYKAKLKPMDLSLDPTDVFIDIPDFYLNALVFYTAARKFNPNGAETIGKGMYHEGNNYWAKYLEEINDLKNNLASTGSMGSNNAAFYRGGWV